jgi:mono/diheme cytochrome c family protein
MLAVSLRAAEPSPADSHAATLFDRYCFECHGDGVDTVSFALDGPLAAATFGIEEQPNGGISFTRVSPPFQPASKLSSRVAPQPKVWTANSPR